jgi:hypothetical protein
MPIGRDAGFVDPAKGFERRDPEVEKDETAAIEARDEAEEKTLANLEKAAKKEEKAAKDEK